MSEDTELNALADLVAVVQATAEVTEVLDYQPAEIHDSLAVVVPLSGTPTDFVFRVELYVRSENAALCQRRIRLIRAAVETELGNQGTFGPSQWEYQWLGEQAPDVWGASFDLVCGREDF